MTACLRSLGARAKFMVKRGGYRLVNLVARVASGRGAWVRGVCVWRKVPRETQRHDSTPFQRPGQRSGARTPAYWEAQRAENRRLRAALDKLPFSYAGVQLTAVPHKLRTGDKVTFNLPGVDPRQVFTLICTEPPGELCEPCEEEILRAQARRHLDRVYADLKREAA